MIEGIDVASLRKGANLDPHRAPKLTVVRGLRAYEDDKSNWMVDQIVRHLKRLSSELEVADLYLPMYRILGGVSNDPEDDNFSPGDQFPAIFDPLVKSDMLLISARSRCGLPDANVVRLVERLSDRAKALSDEKPGVKLFSGQPVAVAVHGCAGAHHAALTLGGVFNKFGMTLCRHGLLCWDEGRGKVEKNDKFASALERVATDMRDLCESLRR